ncbi:3,4-dihydroxy-2-butanone 4-phosphate synthase-domain-containing protein [Suillus paluster]|uniref:3,4-dihydroxy-2-butanone 4-phosphate synthase-domain-containing protein n=1 Tax=Suillus paluster TaxID=48578 RepID=UPI001B85F220|nr:3,4-dihydroxy-2-butanone 4-phosphate synthase-domain-containing protein [Suillus paluster]KAG1723234.1 3,4-dihydroxy-2-butanone 4-phosphate synthase-domain-containing protein [Suillus paluster]
MTFRGFFTTMPTATVQCAVPEHHAPAKANGAACSGSINPTWIPAQVKDVTPRTTVFDTVEEALDAFSRGEAIVVMDDERRENEGDIIISASQCSVEAMAWMIKHTSGYICISLPEERLNELEIPMMVPNNQERHKTAYTITVDYKHGTTTGISAHDRSLTVRKLVDPTSTASDFSRPGHMVPLRAQNGGVLERRGHTETGVDLCALTNQPLGGVLCELVNDDALGTMARRDDCRSFADRWGLKMISVEMLVQYRKAMESRDTAIS